MAKQPTVAGASPTNPPVTADVAPEANCGPGCGCRPTRRDAIRAVGFGVVASLLPRFRTMAGPFEAGQPANIIPADKKLTPEWVKSLYERGEPTVYRGEELRLIGMPVGGIGAGQLYLGGDGRLWHWDLFNRHLVNRGTNYAKPPAPAFPVDQGFALRVSTAAVGDAGKAPPRTLDAKGFGDVSFRGEYPIGRVEYRDPACLVAVSLEAFSPFVPLDVEDSSLPATVMRFTLKNTGGERVEAALTGWLENAVGLNSGGGGAMRENRVVRDGKLLRLECAMLPPDRGDGAAPRSPVVFADFEGEDYGKWVAAGKAFGNGPAKGAPGAEQKLSGFQGKALANSWAKSDQPQGTLTSPEFKVERNFINFLIGGGNHPKQTCIDLLVDGAIVRTHTGKDTDAMAWASWDVRDLAGKTARLEIVDRHSEGWGHIAIDQIEFADASRTSEDFKDLPDVGTMVLALLDAGAGDRGGSSVGEDRDVGAGDEGPQTRPVGQKLVGALGRTVSLEPGQSHTATYVIAWRFPNLNNPGKGRSYAKRFESAAAVAAHVAAGFDRLYGQTKLWRDTWYDSTLPHWFLDRTLLNASVLATSTCYRFANGRFWGWEGVGCCPGTCTHVWSYEQAMGRLFPAIDISLRERVDFNPAVAFNPTTGLIGYRGENRAPAVDGQAGTILRAYRDHQMSADDAFLKRNWAAIRKATEWLLVQDGNDDGLLEGSQHNTLDANWFGPVAWLSGLYLAALRAAEAMATEAGDEAFAKRCRGVFEVGRPKLIQTLFNGEYFINKPDPEHPKSINSGSGCAIDQVFGQSWAFQVGLGRVLPEKETRSALASLWRYNFAPDVGPYRAAHKPGRWYAMPGEAGLLMCTFPKPDWNYEKAKGKGPDWAAGYFNECMNGFEYQVAGHMIWEGMVEEGLAITRAVHDRYHASRRNPWNEVECGDHYARSMASYGAFTAACGYEYHGPKGYLGLAPRLTPDDFRAAFTAAEGWGTFSQKRDGDALRAAIAVKWGRVRLATLGLSPPPGIAGERVKVTAGGKPVDATASVTEGRLQIVLGAAVVLEPGQSLEVVVG